MGRWIATTVGVTVLALGAAGLTEVALAMGHRGNLADDRSVAPVTRSTPSPRLSPSATPTPTVSATPIPSATPSPATTPSVPTAVTNAFVHLRADRSTSSAILIDLNGGTTVILGPDNAGLWQEVTYNGLHGYIYKSYLEY